MFVLNGNQPYNQCQRFMDVSDEPLIMMAPIRGYDKMPLVSLEEAIQPLVPFISEVQQMAYIAKIKCTKPPPDNLTEDQSAAIMLYTLEWEPKETSVYYLLNKILRMEDRQILRPWFLYLKLFFTALSLLPSVPRTVYRGIRGDQQTRYKKGGHVVWWGFSSCTSTMDVLNNESFLGSSGARTLFTIECDNGKDIRQHSYFKREDEVLLPAAREFKVQSVVPQSGQLSIIQLKETQPKYPLLESFSVISQSIQSFPLSPSKFTQLKTPITPASRKPVFTQPTPVSQDQPYCIQPQHSLDENNAISSDVVSSENPRSGSNCCLLACGFIFCCPCTVCYLCCKD